MRARKTTALLLCFSFAACFDAAIGFQTPPSLAATQRKSWISIDDGNNRWQSTSRIVSFAKRKDLSASERERRDEDRRREERKDDVVIGKTSAKPGEKDFEINPKATEQEYLKQASETERIIYTSTDEGMEALKMLQLEKANQLFDLVFKLKPTVYLWQAGIVKFYLNDLQSASKIFSQSAEIFETRFGGCGSEERIWRDACELKIFYSRGRRLRNKESLKEIGAASKIIDKKVETMEDLFMKETRTHYKLVRDLFSSTIENDHSKMVLARAKLRSIGGNKELSHKIGQRSWRVTAWFYLGLHYDVIGEEEEAKNCMKRALSLAPSSGTAEDITQTLPLVHVSVRDWFDDGEFEHEPLSVDSAQFPSNGANGMANESSDSSKITSADPIFEESVRSSIGKLRYLELQDALKLRGLKIVGSKESLQERLYNSLMDDVGLDTGFAP